MSFAPSGPAGRSGPAAHYHFLDWLRVIAIFVLLFFHTGMLFVGWGWHIVNAQTIPGLQWPMDIAHRLRMPLLFMIAGASLWFALRRRSPAGLVNERSKRLLLPLAFGMAVIVPPQIYVERLFRGQFEGGYFKFLLHGAAEFQPYPVGDISWHHLWFIAYLYAYVFILLPVLLWWKHHGHPLQPGAWLYALALPLCVNETLLKPIFPESHDLVHDWYIFNHYLLFTLYGVLFASVPGCWDWLAVRCWRLLGTAVAMIVVVIPAYDHGLIAHDGKADPFVANILTWIWQLAFLGCGRRFLSFDNALLRWSREASYPIYILHQTVIVVLAYWVVQQPYSPGIKYWEVLLSTLAICVLLYEFCIRRLALLRWMFGMKPAAADARRQTQPRAAGAVSS